MTQAPEKYQNLPVHFAKSTPAWSPPRILLQLSLALAGWYILSVGWQLCINKTSDASVNGYFFDALAPIGTASWYKCSFETNLDCGSIIVPLDYLNPNKGKGTVAFARLKAANAPKKGTVFINPGGPGGSGIDFIRRAGASVAQLIGPDYDLVGFDPRGIGQTKPTMDCYSDPASYKAFISNTVLETGFTVGFNISDPRTRSSLIDQQRQFLAMKETQARLCTARMGENLNYMGTPTVVRDIDLMTTALDGKDALINFAGFSYGSILGAYLVNMFPDRIGRVYIDGIANPVLWANKPSQYWHSDWIKCAEEAYDIFFDSCSKAGPEACALATSTGEAPEAIKSRVDAFLDELYARPLPVPGGLRPGYLTAGSVRALMIIYLQAPRAWPTAAQYVASAMSGNGTSFFNQLMASSRGEIGRLGVTCADSPPPQDETEFPTPEELADMGLDTIRDVSKHFGMSVSISEPDGGCQFWPAKPSERFTGPWNHTLKNPILIVSNTADPVTPVDSGRLVNRLLSNSSRLLIQVSPGHSSLAVASLCTIKNIRAYFTNGSLPPNEYVCETDEELFPHANSISMDVQDKFLHDDARLIRAAQYIGTEMMRLKLDGGS